MLLRQRSPGNEIGGSVGLVIHPQHKALADLPINHPLGSGRYIQAGLDCQDHTRPQPAPLAIDLVFPHVVNIHAQQQIGYGVTTTVEVATDLDLGDIKLLDYVIVEDAGTMINPMVVDGQVLGGATQGIGTAHVPFPLTTASIGTKVFVQWMVQEPSSLAFSDAAVFKPFQF